MNVLKEWLVEAAAGSVIWLGLALLVCAVMRRRPAAVRHAVWGSAFAGCLLYAGALFLPEMNLAVLEAVPEAAEIVPEAAVSPALIAEKTAASDPEPIALRAPDTVSPVALWPLAWLVGAGVLLGRLALGLAGLWGVSRKGKLVPQHLLELPEGARVRVIQSSRIEVPVTWGVFRPCILLPGDFFAWAGAERRFALRHEWGHIVRRDWIVQLMAQFIRGLFWFNPLAWVGVRRLTLEQEKAADDFVIAREEATLYANVLLKIVERVQAKSTPFPALPMFRKGSLEERVRALLDRKVGRGPVTWRVLCVMSLAVAAGAGAGFVELSAKEASRRLSEMEQRFVGTWRGGGMLPSVMTFGPDGRYHAQPYMGTNLVEGIWKVEGDLLTYEAQSPTNRVSKRRILQVSSNFFQWQFVGESSANIFGYHRLTNIQLGTIAGVVQRKGKPLPETRVLLEPVTPDGSLLPRTEVVSDREGRFAFHGLAPGRYRVSREIQWESATDRGSTTTGTWTHHQMVEVAKDRTSEMVPASGRVLTGELAPPPGVARREIAFGAGDFRFLTPAERAENMPNAVYVLELGEDGRFEIPDVPPGTYNLYVSVRRKGDMLDAPEYAEVQAQELRVPEGAGEFSLGRFELREKNR